MKKGATAPTSSTTRSACQGGEINIPGSELPAASWPKNPDTDPRNCRKMEVGVVLSKYVGNSKAR